MLLNMFWMWNMCPGCYDYVAAGAGVILCGKGGFLSASLKHKGGRKDEAWVVKFI